MKKYLFANASLVVEINEWAENKRAGDLEPSDFTIKMNKGWIVAPSQKKKVPIIKKKKEPIKLDKMQTSMKEDMF